MKKQTMPVPVVMTHECLMVAFELSNKQWKLGFSNGSRERITMIDARDLKQFQAALAKTRRKFGLEDTVPIYSCYEAGRDGFWLHRALESCGITNFVLDPSSIEVPRKQRRAKTDDLDTRSLLRLLWRYLGGERKAFSVVRVPPVEAEDARCLHREIEVLQKERGLHRNRLSSLLIAQGLAIPTTRRFLKHQLLPFLEEARTGEGRP